jgi:cytidylate kinase
VLVTISGLPGSGTSTVASRVAAALDVPRLDGGTVWRSMAAERGLSIPEFSALSEADPAIDVELDRRLAEAARAGGVVLESRLAGWIATNEGVASGGGGGGDGVARVWIACDDVERARRVAEREGLDLRAALAANADREASEAKRYRDYYAIDLADLSPYDLVLDSTTTGPDDLVAAILKVVAP